jgi:hypothetical protein
MRENPGRLTDVLLQLEDKYRDIRNETTKH